MKTFLKLIFALLLMNSGFSFAQSDQFEKIIRDIKQKTEIGYYSFNEKEFHEAIALCDRILSIDPVNVYALYYKTYSIYRVLNVGMVQKKGEYLSNYLDVGLETGNKLLQCDFPKSEAHTLLAAIQLMNLAQNPELAAQLFLETGGYISKAIDSDSLNPRAYIIKGVLMFNTPAQFGGGPKTSMKLLTKANSLFDNQTQPNELMPTWGKYEAKAWLGFAHQTLGELTEAKNIYTAILEEQPNYGWVKHQLLPSLDTTNDGIQK